MNTALFEVIPCLKYDENEIRIENMLLTVRGRSTAVRSPDTGIQCVLRRHFQDLRRSIYLDHFYYFVNRERFQNLPR